MSQKITPFLWFNDDAEEAINFYLSIFKNGKILSLRKGSDGKVFSGEFEIEGQKLMVMNAGSMFPFTEAISLFVECQDQVEVDMYWNKLTEGGKESQCGWLKDRYGLSWQIVPKALGELLSDGMKAPKVMEALMNMKKIDIEVLKKAA